jgi:hypothetical protein
LRNSLTPNGHFARDLPFGVNITAMSGSSDWVTWVLVAAAVVVAAVLVVIWRKGRPFAEGDVFKASRISTGNRLFPTQVLITPTSIVQYTPRWIGRQQETIHMAHVASVKIDTGLLLSNVLIETSGGADPILCHGHRKGDAVRMQQLIERYQSEHYRSSAGSAKPPQI